MLLGASFIAGAAYLVLTREEGRDGAVRVVAVLAVIFGVAIGFFCGHGYVIDAQPTWGTETLPLAYGHVFGPRRLRLRPGGGGDQDAGRQSRPAPRSWEASCGRPCSSAPSWTPWAFSPTGCSSALTRSRPKGFCSGAGPWRAASSAC